MRRSNARDIGRSKGSDSVHQGRHFTVAVFVVHDGRVVLMRHPRLGLWLPPGGHVDDGETPDETAVREVFEETGLLVELLGQMGPAIGVTPLVRPLGIQLEPIGPGHEHIDLIYAACIKEGSGSTLSAEAGTRGLGWYSPEDARCVGASDEVIYWIGKALSEAGNKMED